MSKSNIDFESIEQKDKKIEQKKKNQIIDVPGVLVGQVTIKDGEINTGVTAILPHGGNIFKEKVRAGCYVINGFAKSMGLTQVQELGTIETPIILTNTLSVGTAFNGVVKYMLEHNEDIGYRGTVNPVVCECNDGRLSDIRGLHIEEQHIIAAIENAKENNEYFEEGSVGAGTGMISFGMKSGIGSASRVIKLGDTEYNLGVLVLSNFGVKERLNIKNISSLKDESKINVENFNKDVSNEIKIQKAKEETKEKTKEKPKEEDRGSIIIVIATDIPMSSRQLKRVSKRGAAGLGGIGSYLGHGSGDIAIAFSTANKIKHLEKDYIINNSELNENKIDRVFAAVKDSTEEAILKSMINSDETIDINGIKIDSLKELLK